MKRRGLSSVLVDAVLERDQHSCCICGNNLSGTRGQQWSLHHRRPRAMGGSRRADTDLPANLVSVCGSGTTGCHGWLESHRIEAIEQGFLLRQADTPTDVAVSTWYGAVLLDNKGFFRIIRAAS